MRFRNIGVEPWISRPRFWRVQLVYLAASSLFLLGFLWLPANQRWLTTTIQRFYEQRRMLGDRWDVPFRQRKGYGNAYVYTTLIRQHCKPTDYFLIPPQRYLIKKAHRQGLSDGFVWVYPSVLYYHLGRSVRLVEMTDADSLVRRATYTFLGNQNQLSLLKLTNQNRAAVLTQFKQYDPHFFAYTPEQAQAYYKSTP